SSTARCARLSSATRRCRHPKPGPRASRSCWRRSPRNWPTRLCRTASPRMPLFTPSTLVVTAAQSVVAESAGAQADTDMLTRALRALDATAQRWNRLKWKFLQQEQMLVLVAPFTVTGVSTTAGGTTITTSVAAGFASVLAQDMVPDGSTVFRGDTQVAATGPPAAADVAHIRYMRRISMPSSATAAVLDVPQDYEDVFLAAAKAYFLADKKEDLPRVQYWAEYARAGMAQIRSDEHWVPDELLA